MAQNLGLYKSYSNFDVFRVFLFHQKNKKIPFTCKNDVPMYFIHKDARSDGLSTTLLGFQFPVSFVVNVQMNRASILSTGIYRILAIRCNRSQQV